MSFHSSSLTFNTSICTPCSRSLPHTINTSLRKSSCHALHKTRTVVGIHERCLKSINDQIGFNSLQRSNLQAHLHCWIISKLHGWMIFCKKGNTSFWMPHYMYCEKCKGVHVSMMIYRDRVPSAPLELPSVGTPHLRYVTRENSVKLHVPVTGIQVHYNLPKFGLVWYTSMHMWQEADQRPNQCLQGRIGNKGWLLKPSILEQNSGFWHYKIHTKLLIKSCITHTWQWPCESEHVASCTRTRLTKTVNHAG